MIYGYDQARNMGSLHNLGHDCHMWNLEQRNERPAEPQVRLRSTEERCSDLSAPSHPRNQSLDQHQSVWSQWTYFPERVANAEMGGFHSHGGNYPKMVGL